MFLSSPGQNQKTEKLRGSLQKVSVDMRPSLFQVGYKIEPKIVDNTQSEECNHGRY
jgi:hypothetical protein